MTSLYDELRSNTMSNMDSRRAKQEQEKQQHDAHLSEVVDKLYQQIADTCVERMITASHEGHFYATLFSFTNQDMFEDFKTVFLIRGPFRSKYTYGLAYFEQRNIVPVISRLREKYAPVEIYMKYDRSNRTHHLMATWKTE